MGRLLAIARTVLLLLVLGVVTVVLVRNWHAVGPYVAAVSPAALALGFLGALGSPVLSVFGWRALLADLGSPLHVAPAASVFLVGQLGKYLPGSLWSVVVQSELGSRLGVPRRRTGVAGLLAMVLALLTGIVLGLPAAPRLIGGHGNLAAAVAVGAIALAVVLWPPILNALVTRGLALLHRAPLKHPLTGRAIAAMAGWFVLSWASSSAMIYVLARSIGGPGVETADLAFVSGPGFILATAIGMLSVVLPAGVGVREGILVVLLGSLMPIAAATAVVVIARFLSVVADVLLAGASWLWARAHHLLPEDR
ncbi:MAG: flippase-like domain-containing protein [Tetrasphaera sp.]|nr:flippase-like domain-containing protein [Tetrasphaera sp.]